MANEQRGALAQRRYFWGQLVLLATGVCGLAVAHRVASWDADSRLATFGTAALAGLSLAVAARASWLITARALSDAYRVFRSRHLLVCASLLASAAAIVATSVVHGPFDRVLAHGRITGADLADLGSVVTVFVCTVAAVVAASGAWDALRDERHWHRSL
jgi:hypothetical protein